MDLKELLEKAGVKDVDRIIADMKANKIFTAGEENLDIRYGKLKEQTDAQSKELAEARKLIDELKKAGSGNEELQKRISEYDAKVTELQEQLSAARLESALKVALLKEKAVDVDYMMFKLGKEGLTLTDDGNIKGLDSKIEELKKAYPTQFESSSRKIVKEQKLPDDPSSHSTPTVTKEQFGKMGYQARLKLMKENPEEYRKLAGKEE